MGLTRRRRAVYRSLIRALQADPASGHGHRGATAATRAFAAWYGRQEPHVRHHADTVLDHLDALGLDRDPQRGLRALRECGAAGGGAPTPAQSVHCAAVAAALALVEAAT